MIALAALTFTVPAFATSSVDSTACYDQAYAEAGWNMTEEAAFQVCKGSFTPEKMNCVEKAYVAEDGLGLTDAQTAELCSGESSLGNIACYAHAYAEDKLNLSQEASFKLCRGKFSQGKIDCAEAAIKLTEYGFSDDDVATLCAGSASAKTIDCFKTSFSKLGLNFDRDKAIQFCSSL